MAVRERAATLRRPGAGGNAAVRGVLRSGGARLAVLPVSAVLGIVCTRLIIDHYGTAAYAQYTLLVGIINVLPFADLGMSAAIMNAVASSRDPAHDPAVHRVLLTSIRVLFASMAVFLVAALAFLFSDVWPGVLGDGLLPVSGPVAATLCLVVIGISLPVGFGQRILSGLGRNHVTVILLGLQTPVMLVVLLLMTSLDLPGGAYLAVIAYLVTFVISAVTCWTAARRITPAVGTALHDVPRLRTERGAEVMSTAWPTLVQLMALPIALQTDRIVLSHVTSLDQLAQYSLASQMFTPVGAVVAAAGFALWPVFAKARAQGGRTASPQKLSLAFGATAALVCLLIALVSPWLARAASGGEISLSIPLILAFGAFMVGQALKNPLGMYMTAPEGLRFQAWIILFALVPANLALSIVLAHAIGAPGPVIASAVTVLLCQVLPNWWWVRRDQRRRAAAEVPAGGPGTSGGAEEPAAQPG
ncbi:lipopolysaccharide biosynthesis protein [Jatrophihabitans sp. YIM 134969]